MTIYQIRVEGRLDDRWAEWFSGLEITVERINDSPTITTLIGPIPDQAALRGILNRAWDLNLKLVSVNQLEDMGQYLGFQDHKSGIR